MKQNAAFELFPYKKYGTQKNRLSHLYLCFIKAESIGTADFIIAAELT